MRLSAVLLGAPPLALLLLGFLLPPPQAVHPPLAPPREGLLLGSDLIGRDVLGLLAHGAKTTLGVGVAAGTLSTLLGALLGGLAGLLPRWEPFVNGLTNLFLAFPRLPLLVLLALYLKPSPWNAVAVLVLFGWPATARVLQPAVAGLREAGHVRVARALGAGTLYLLSRHILPQTAPLLFASLLLEVRFALVAQTGLAFLGLTDPSLPSWGLMLFQAFRDGATFAGPSWLWTVLPPSLAIALSVLALTLPLLADPQGLDPRLRR